MHHNNQDDRSVSVLATLRALVPTRTVDFRESLIIAELQANRLLELSGIMAPAVPEAIVTDLPRIEVRYRRLPTSGISYWNAPRRSWIIGIKSSEPLGRQRFTLLHEYKHIIDHGRTHQLYTGSHGSHGSHRTSHDSQAEHAADYFAGCALMPKRLVKSAWGNGVQRPDALAQLFDVSERAIEVRLSQLGLTDDQTRCSPHGFNAARQRGARRYYRQSKPLLALEDQDRLLEVV